MSVAIIEDQQRTREGLAALLAGESDLAVVWPFGSVEEALAPLLACPPDVLLCDIALPGMSGIDGVRRTTGTSSRRSARARAATC